jgi:hypothetical protein
VHQPLSGFDEELRVALVGLGLGAEVSDVQVCSVEIEASSMGECQNGHIIEVGEVPQNILILFAYC